MHVVNARAAGNAYRPAAHGDCLRSILRFLTNLEHLPIFCARRHFYVVCVG